MEIQILVLVDLWGQKNYNDLKALNPELIDVIDYGWFTFIAKPMFTLLIYSKLCW